MNNLRDLLGYGLDVYDVLLFRHRFYSFCKFVANVFSPAENTTVSRTIQPRFERVVRHLDRY